MIGIIDYGTGNICSVTNALRRLGCEYSVLSDSEAIRSVDRIILPGVGEASSAMRMLRDRGLDTVVRSLTQPVLGICIGMQLMCMRSEEGNTECMGIFDTSVTKFSFDENLRRQLGLKIPHMGWNTLEDTNSMLFDGLSDGFYVYYVHSYAPEICKDTIATTTYYTKFSGALQNGNFFGTQFHPEKKRGNRRKNPQKLS